MDATLMPAITPAVQKVTPSDGEGRAWFGMSVAVFGDIALAGAPNATVNGHQGQGAVYIYNRVNGIWKQTQKLVASDGAAGDQFGQVATLFNGKTIIIAAPLATVGGQTWVGAAYLFSLVGTSWVQKQKLTPNGGEAFGTFGKCIALNAKYALIGAGGASTNNQYVKGSLYVFTFVPSNTGGSWNQTQRILAPDPNDDTAFFGCAAAMTNDTAIVGAYASTVGGNLGQGITYVFSLSGGNWILSDKLTASDGAARDNFGVSLALQGKTAFIGAPGNATSQGAVYRFEKQGAHWVQAQKLTALDGTQISFFGASVNFANARVLVGAYATNSYRGAAYVFSASSGGVWAQRRKMAPADAETGDVFGYHTALDNDTALVSSWGADVGNNPGQGVAYLYHLGPLGPAPTT